jgi:uncharacterized protein YndB with AHSA1/START domain
MFKAIAIIVVVLVAFVLTYAATRPDTFSVQRSTTIKAPPEKVFALINDFRRWDAWSPYEKKDPAMKRVMSDPASGQGAAYEWDGNKDVGKGNMQITRSLPPSAITIQLDFVRPFETHNVVEFTLEPVGDTTEVTWAMHGPSPYVAKVMGVFFNMDRMIGKDFEAGLADLKAVAES